MSFFSGLCCIADELGPCSKDRRLHGLIWRHYDRLPKRQGKNAFLVDGHCKYGRAPLHFYRDCVAMRPMMVGFESALPLRPRCQIFGHGMFRNIG